MIHDYHVMYSVRYYPRLHVTAVGLGTYYPRIWWSACVWHRLRVMGFFEPVELVVLCSGRYRSGRWGQRSTWNLSTRRSIADELQNHQHPRDNTRFCILWNVDAFYTLQLCRPNPQKIFCDFRDECRDSTLQYATTLFPDLLSTNPWLRSSHICLCIRTLSNLTVCRYERFPGFRPSVVRCSGLLRRVCWWFSSKFQ